jgi:hypothetical protein
LTFPWELLYPKHYSNGRGVYDPKLFWGYRFQIESLLFPDSDDEKLPEKRQQEGRLFVSLGVNKAIDEDWTEHRPVEFHKKYCAVRLKHCHEYLTEYERILDIFTKPHAASLIYFYCHGTEDELIFDEAQESLTPDSVDLAGGRYPGWPIIFLNACSAGDISPLSFFSFRTEFRRKGAAGLIAPSFPIPTLFAAVFAKHVLHQYAARRPIGEILLDVRGDLLAKENPLGLWYSLQCPLDIIAPVN